MNCCICGPVKNCGPYLRKVFDNIEKIGSLFDDYKILIFWATGWQKIDYSIKPKNKNNKYHIAGYY